MRRPYEAFCHTVIQGKIESPWNTIELSGRLDPAGTSISIEPALAVSSPARIRSSVVLPHPDGPTIMKNSPGEMSSDTWSTATRLPNDLTRSRIRMAGRAEALAFATGRRFTAAVGIPDPEFDRDRYCRESSAPTTMANYGNQASSDTVRRGGAAIWRLAPWTKVTMSPSMSGRSATSFAHNASCLPSAPASLSGAN